MLAHANDMPLLHQRMFAPYKIAILADAAAERGIARELTLSGTELTLKSLRDPHALTSVSDYLRALENIIAAGADLSIAFEVGSRLHLSAYGMYGYALMCSPTVREFCNFAVRYHLLATPMLGLEWRQEGDLAIWTFDEIYHSVMSREARNFIARQQMMMTVTHLRDVAGANVRPLRARFGLTDIGVRARDEQIIGCACDYDAATHELVYPSSILDKAPQFANRLTHKWLEDTCDELIGQTRVNSGLAGEISQLLMRAPNLSLTMQVIASQRGMTERTLRRRLERENVRYADIEDDVRRKLALRYIQTTRMSADDIAVKVGFSDTSNLRRAIKRWTGGTIGDLRGAEDAA